MQSGEYVNRALEKIASQTYVLTINNVMNNELHRIISDFKFEFYALDTDLSHDNYAKYFLIIYNSLMSINKIIYNSSTEALSHHTEE